MTHFSWFSLIPGLNQLHDHTVTATLVVIAIFVWALLAGADGMADLGRHFGADLYERELRYLVRAEWAETASDILERRTKHGLHLDSAAASAVADWLRREQADPIARQA